MEFYSYIYKVIINKITHEEFKSSIRELKELFKRRKL